MKSLCSSTNTMQQVLDEAGRLLKLLWRVSLPAAFPTGESSSNQQVVTNTALNVRRNEESNPCVILWIRMSS